MTHSITVPRISMLIVVYDEYDCAKCRYAEYRYAKCCISNCHHGVATIYRD
jgi:hypothetical protein